MAAPMENVCDNLFKPILLSFLSKESNIIPLKHFLQILESNQMLSSLENVGSMQDLTSYVHSCLGNSKLRAGGLTLLGVVVRQCTTEVFQNNALTWIKLLLQILQSHCPCPMYAASCKVLGEVIQFSKTFSDLSREMISSVLPQILPVLINCTNEVMPSAISCINACIRTYPGPVGPFRNKLEVLILQQIDNGEDKEAVYRCYSLLSQCGPGGPGGVKHAEAWSSQCNKLIGSLESTLEALYNDLESELRHQRIEGESLNLPSIDFGREDRVTALVSRWKTLTGCMVSMLSEEVNTAVKVPTDMILQLVYGCLSVNVSVVMQRPTAERSLLAAYIPEIHDHVLDVLTQLILLCTKNLVPYCTDIMGVLCQELVWTQTSNYGYSKQYGALRQKVYSVLTTWLKALNGCSGAVLEETTLVKHILQDCAPFSDSLQLTSKSSNTSRLGEMTSKKNKKKKKGYHGYQEISHGISSQRKVYLLCNSELVTAALDALYWLMTTAGCELSAKRVQEVQAFVIQTLLLVQQSRDLPAPYSSSSCRKGLYKVLQACVLSPHPKAPPPTNCALQLFTTGTLDKCLEVGSLCMEASRVCEVLIHPRAPCLNGPVICENLVYIGRTTESPENTVFSKQLSGYTENEISRSVNLEVSTERMDLQTNGDTDVEAESGNTLKRKRQTVEIENDKEEESKSKQIRVKHDSVGENMSDNVEKNIRESEETATGDRESDSHVEIADKTEKESGTNKSQQDTAGYIFDSEDKKVKNKTRKETKAKQIMVQDNLIDKTLVKPGTNRQEVDEEKILVSRDDNNDDSNIDDDGVKGKDTSVRDDTEKIIVAEEPDEEVKGMMSAFVDAGPDSD